MPFVYIYSPSDFVGGLPPEYNAEALGSPYFFLRLSSDATPTLVEVTDNDTFFNEVDYSQSLTNDTVLNGNFYSAGTSIHQAYDLVNSADNHIVSTLHFGGDGYQQGGVHGLVSNIELVPGRSYLFDQERSSFNQGNEYVDYYACFAGGTLITTDRGPVAVEALRTGDMIATAEGNFAPLRLKLSRSIQASELQAHPQLRPVRIGAGSLGMGLPTRDLLVSPQHRMLAVSPIVKRMFGRDQVLVAAKKLTALNGIYIDDQIEQVSYFHLVLDGHEIIYAENTPTESFYCGPFAIEALSSEAVAELHSLFPDLMEENFTPLPACHIPEGRLQNRLITRHKKNEKALLCQN